MLILLIVAALLRALVAPLYVIGTVMLSLRVRDRRVARSSSATADPAHPLFTFIFLVALGVDYNIFLITRIHEASTRRCHADAVIDGLERTGGVITSAGLILAGTFATLMAIPSSKACSRSASRSRSACSSTRS